MAGLTEGTWSDVDSGLPQTPADKLAQAGILKERGNQLFKLEQWKAATKCYHHALMYIRSVLSSFPDDSLLKTLFLKTGNPLQQPSSSENESARQMLLALSNNLAVCMLKMEQWERVVKHCTTVLEHESENIKALYRRGVAYLHLGLLDESETDLKMAMQIDPTDSSVRRQYAVLQDKLKQHWEKEKQKYQGLFSSQSDRNPPAAGESNTN